MRIRLSLLAALALAVLAPAAPAQDLAPADRAPAELAPARAADEAPARFTYSGLLTTADGTAVADGPRALVFRGYPTAEAAADGAGPDWEEAHEAAVVGGRFLAVLGSRADVPAGVRYLTVAVDGERPSAPVRLDRGPEASAFAPGNTLQDSYLNGRTIDITTGSPIQIRGAAGQLGLIVRDVVPVFITDQLARFRLTSGTGGGAPGSPQIWEYRVYGTNSVEPGPGAFAIADATGGGSDGFTMFPGVAENLLNLRGTTVSVGSPTSPRSFQAYTTPNPADPGGGFVNYRLLDLVGLGAASSWFTETGVRHTFIEPDAGGEGGYFYVDSGSGIGFAVDGVYQSGSRIQMGSGLGASVFTTTTFGPQSVALPLDAVDAVEIQDEAGASNRFSASTVVVTSGANITLSRTITAPTDGYVIAMASGEMRNDHTAGSTQLTAFGVSRDCDASPSLPEPQRSSVRIPASAATGDFRDIVSNHALFPVDAGATTFCIVVDVSAGTGISVDDQNLTLLFVPTAYGGIQSIPAGSASSDEEQGPARAPMTVAEVEAERAASIQANEARESAEVAALRARVEALEARMGNGQNDL